SQSGEHFKGMRTALYLFVDDVETVHRRAVENGAMVEFEPDNMPYGDRQSGIIDPCGNYWWISKRLTKKGYHE
ncbi:MAG TPA: VOC family protein, partial [Leptospiraceae bacterium]|nr:VOC family protein [Leptospiraceae bacterium]